MLLYAILLFLAAALTLLTGLLTCFGFSELVYDPAPRSMPGRARYTLANGIVTSVSSVFPAFCGVAFLLTPETLMALIGIGVLLIGTVATYLVTCLIRRRFLCR